MKGTVEIYQHVNGVPAKVAEESNMIVDGARNQIADILTHNPQPSSLLPIVELNQPTADNKTYPVGASSFIVGEEIIGAASIACVSGNEPVHSAASLILPRFPSTDEQRAGRETSHLLPYTYTSYPYGYNAESSLKDMQWGVAASAGESFIAVSSNCIFNQANPALTYRTFRTTIPMTGCSAANLATWDGDGVTRNSEGGQYGPGLPVNSVGLPSGVNLYFRKKVRIHKGILDYDDGGFNSVITSYTTNATTANWREEGTATKLDSDLAKTWEGDGQWHLVSAIFQPLVGATPGTSTNGLPQVVDYIYPYRNVVDASASSPSESACEIHQKDLQVYKVYSLDQYDKMSEDERIALAESNKIGNYQIAAMSLGAPGYAQSLNDSRYGLVKYHGSDSTEYLAVSGVGSGIHALRTELSNSVFQKPVENALKVAKPPIFEDTRLQGSVVQKEGDPWIDTTGGVLRIKKRYGQDYAVVRLPLSLPDDAVFYFYGNATLPFKLELIRQETDHRLSMAPMNTEWYDWEKHTFVGTKIQKTMAPFDGLTSFTYVDRDHGDAVSIRDKYVYSLMLTAPEPNYKTLGEVNISRVVRTVGFDESLENDDFSTGTTFVGNYNFRDFRYDPSSGGGMAQEFGLAKYDYWETYNPLASSVNPIFEASSLGSVTLKRNHDNINTVVLQASSNGTGASAAGGASITQEFVFPANQIPRYSKIASPSGGGGPYEPILKLNFGALVASANSSGIEVSFENVTKNTSYSFTTGTTTRRGEWGENNPLIVSESAGNAARGIFNNVSEFINISSDDVYDRYRITFTARETQTLAEFAKYELRSVMVGFLDGWEFGRPVTANGYDTTLLTLTEPTIGSSGIVFSGDNTDTVVSGDTYANTVYLSQKFTGLVPNRKYNLLLDIENTASAVADYGQLGVVLEHNDYTTDVYQYTDVITAAGLTLQGAWGECAGGLLNAGYQRFYSKYTSPYASATMPGLSVSSSGYNFQKDAVVKYEPFPSPNVNDVNVVPYVPVDESAEYKLIMGGIATSANTTAYQASANLALTYQIPAIDGTAAALTYNFVTKTWDDVRNPAGGRYPDDNDRPLGPPSLGLDAFYSVDVVTSSMPKDTEISFSSIVRTPSVDSRFKGEDGSMLLCPILFVRDKARNYESPQWNRISNVSDFNFYIKDISMVGRYVNATDTTAHASLGIVGESNYDGLSTNVESRFSTGRVYHYNFSSQVWDGYLIPPRVVNGDMASRNEYLQYTTSSIPSNFHPVSTGSEKRATVCLPVVNMDNFNGVQRDPYLGTLYDAKVGGTDKSTYTLSLIKAAGGGMVVHDARIVDVGLMNYTGPARTESRYTRSSEHVYSGIARSSPVGGWHSSPKSYTSSSMPKLWVSSIDEQNYLYSTPGVGAGDSIVSLSHSDYIRDTNIQPGNFKVSFDYFSDVAPSAAVSYYDASGSFYMWNFDSSAWRSKETLDLAADQGQGFTQTASSFPYDSSYADKETNYLSSAITLGDLNPDGIITTHILAGSGNPGAYRDLRYYNVYDSVSAVFPSFPNPQDTTLQPTDASGSGRLGQFLNTMEYYGSGVDKSTYERAIYDGAYAPASGITFFSGVEAEPRTAYGNLNRFSVVTPNGYILEQLRSPRQYQILPDSSCGFVMQNLSEPVEYGASTFYAGVNVLDRVTLGSNGHGEGLLITSSSAAAQEVVQAPSSHQYFTTGNAGGGGKNPTNGFTALQAGAGSGVNPFSRNCIVVSSLVNDNTASGYSGFNYFLSGLLVPSGASLVTAEVPDFNDEGYYLLSLRFASVSGDPMDKKIQMKIATTTAGDPDIAVLNIAQQDDYRWGEHIADGSRNGVSASTSAGVNWFTGSAIAYVKGRGTDENETWKLQLMLNPLYTDQSQYPAGHQTAAGGFTGWFSSSVGKSIFFVDDIQFRYLYPSPQGTKLALTLSRDEWDLLNSKYGGVGALGAHVMDYHKSGLKKGSDRGVGGPPFIPKRPYMATDGYDSPVLEASSWPAGPPNRAPSGVMGAEYLNAFCLKAVEEDVATQGVNRLISTRFGSPPGEKNMQGWASSTGDYTLRFDYKVVDNPQTPAIPDVRVQSAHFTASSLIADSRWHQFSSTFSVGSDTLGENNIMWYFSLDDDYVIGENELYLTNVSLEQQQGTILKSYDFTNPTQVSAFSNAWSTPNYITLDHAYDGWFYETSLYNSAELIDNSPEFNLFAKKVFFPGGLQLADESDAITIIWTITP